jgi:hypothetical protein
MTEKGAPVQETAKNARNTKMRMFFLALYAFFAVSQFIALRP